MTQALPSPIAELGRRGEKDRAKSTPHVRAPLDRPSCPASPRRPPSAAYGGRYFIGSSVAGSAETLEESVDGSAGEAESRTSSVGIAAR